MRFLFVTGGVRSGKSRFAEQLAERQNGSILYVATANIMDEEMEARVRLHQQRRPNHWGLLESSYRLADTVSQYAPYQVVLIDSLSAWVSNRLLEVPEEQYGDEQITKRILQEAEYWANEIRRFDGTVILVSDETGLGGVAMSRLGRWFQDVLGEANQIMAERANEMYVLFSGIQLKIKG